MARESERVDEDTAVCPRFGQDPPPKFLSADTGLHVSTMEARSSTLQKNQQGRWLLRQLKGESRTAAEVVMDEALIQDDGVSKTKSVHD